MGGPTTFHVFIVSDPHTRIDAYQRQADECLAKAENSADETVRRQYLRLAETYRQLVEMELRRMKIRGSAQAESGPAGKD